MKPGLVWAVPAGPGQAESLACRLAAGVLLQGPRGHLASLGRRRGAGPDESAGHEWHAWAHLVLVQALLEGVPPSDPDRPSNTATAADCRRQYRRAGLHGFGRALHEKDGFRFDEPSHEGQMEVEENCQICTRRSG